jgi:hypothetical protein
MTGAQLRQLAALRAALIHARAVEGRLQSLTHCTLATVTDAMTDLDEATAEVLAAARACESVEAWAAIEQAAGAAGALGVKS